MTLRDISCGKFMICMDIFAELGLVDYNYVRSTVKRKNVTKKADLSSSEILKDLKNKGE